MSIFFRNKYILISILFIASFTGCHFTDTKKIALGTIERDRILLTAIQSEIIEDIYVHEGDIVTKGTKLAKLDDTKARLSIEKAQAQLDAAAAVLNKLQNGARSEDVAAIRARLLAAKSDINYLSKSLGRIEKLVKGKHQSQSALDLEQAKYDAAKAHSDEISEELLKLTNGSRPEDIMVAAANVDAAKASLALANEISNELTITATRDGTVEALPWNIGERVTLGSPVVVLLATETPYVRAYIPFEYRGKYNKGDKIKIHVDGMSQLIEGTFSKIASQASYTPYYGLSANERSHLVYLSEVDLPSSAANLPNGLAVELLL